MVVRSDFDGQLRSRTLRSRRQSWPIQELDPAAGFNLNFAIFPHADHFSVARKLEILHVPEQIVRDSQPDASFDLGEEVAHHGAVFDALRVVPFEIEFAKAHRLPLPIAT